MRINRKVIVFILIIVVIFALLFVFVKKDEKPVAVVENTNTQRIITENVNVGSEAKSELASIIPVALKSPTEKFSIDSNSADVAEYVQIARARARQFMEIADDVETTVDVRGETIIVRFYPFPEPEPSPPGERRSIGHRYFTSIVIDIKTKSVLRGPGKMQ